MGIALLENLKSKFLAHHQKLEDSLLSLQTKVNLQNSIFLFLVGVVLFFSISKVPLKENNLLEILSTNQGFLINQMATNSFWGLIILSSYAVILFLVTKKLSKIRYNLAHLFFFIGFACLLLFISQILWATTFHLLSPFNLGFLGSIFTILTIYVIIASFKVLIKTDLVSFFINHVISINLAVFVILFIALIINAITPQPKYITYELSKDGAGSNVIYGSEYTNQVCSASFANNWKLLNATEAELFSEKNNEDFKYLEDYQMIINSDRSNQNFFVFDRIPPAKIMEYYDLLDTYESLSNHNTSGLSVNLINTTTIRGYNITFLDVSYEGSLRHNLSISSKDNCLGYEGIYQESQYSQEGVEDFVKNIECYYKGGDPYSESAYLDKSGLLNINYSFKDPDGLYSCVFKFPNDWNGYTAPIKIKNEFIRHPFCNTHYNLLYKKPVDNMEVKEFLKFSSLPPTIYGYSVKDYCKYTDKEENFDGAVYALESASYSLLNNGEACIKKFSDKNKKTIYYDVLYARKSDNAGYKLTYESPYGQDEDLYYILNNTKCYKYS
ncbi:US12 family protein [Candidatus Micrarchaeota archaeon]|nr:US12 family protein [Candidatus Micrarchaeota archaeon]